ncbi:MAG: arginine deiminase-related protein [Kangiellaceae bacterium]|jgi:hypothetical protein|nr:arginine deiminase-related protein [Kangiellaceae bacterium]
MQRHATNQIIMTPPLQFGFNEQTGLDNHFQQRSLLTPKQITEQAICEFNAAVKQLKQSGISVIEFANPSERLIPDAVFLNNWFSTDQQGSLFVYPMKTRNRQGEVVPIALKDSLTSHGFTVNKIHDVAQLIKPSLILEGTGALVFDHINRIAYAAQSERCDADLMVEFCRAHQWQPIMFTTQSSNGKPIYHTNVMMSIGDKFAVVCLECIDRQHRQTVKQSLQNNGKTVIDITLQQMEQSFCGNILQLVDANDSPIIVMSSSAHRGFNQQQKDTLASFGKLIQCDIPTIESVGGGSLRCMIAENFLTKCN